jgi:hypothetical protein
MSSARSFHQSVALLKRILPPINRLGLVADDVHERGKDNIVCLIDHTTGLSFSGAKAA